LVHTRASVVYTTYKTKRCVRLASGHGQETRADYKIKTNGKYESKS
jgi:hypothetical protein